MYVWKINLNAFKMTYSIINDTKLYKSQVNSNSGNSDSKSSSFHETRARFESKSRDSAGPAARAEASSSTTELKANGKVFFMRVLDW